MLVTEDEREAVIKKFVEEMGFPEEAARAAMRAAFYNPDRATEYLLSGTTPAPSGGFDTTTTPAPAPAPSPAPAPAPTGSNGLSQMRNDPRLNQLRELLRRNPENLPLVLEQIGRQHPRLLQQIRDNRGEFIRMLNEPSPQVEVKNSQTRARQLLLPSFAAKRKEFAAQVGIAEEHFTGLLTHIQNIPQDALLRFIRLLVSAVPDGGRPPAGTITLTRSEEQSIIRLTEMGFSRSKAIEAFLACDKNEEMAANFLFDNP